MDGAEDEHLEEARAPGAAIQHVVLLVLRHRSFDSVLGWMDHSKLVTGNEEEGDSAYSEWKANVQDDIRSLDPSEFVECAVHPRTSPRSDHRHVRHQMYGECEQVDWSKRPTMNGFCSDYGDNGGESIMSCIAPEMLPAINTLAKEYAVCDRWFSSVPSGSAANQLFLLGGSSYGVIDSVTEGYKCAGNQSVMSHLDTWVDPAADGEWSWKVYSHDKGCDMSSLLYPELLRSDSGQYVGFEMLKHDAENGTLPAFAVIEARSYPDMDGERILPRNDHVPSKYSEKDRFHCPVWEADKLVLDVYDTLFGCNAKSPKDTLLLVVYDTHGGCFDHAIPPPAPSPHPRLPEHDGFSFQRLGVRVPVLLISPRICRNTVLRPGVGENNWFDHTSVVASLCKKWNAGPLSLRAKEANTVWSIIGDVSDHYVDVPGLQAKHQELDHRLALSIGTPGSDVPRETNFVSSMITSITKLELISKFFDNPSQNKPSRPRGMAGRRNQPDAAAMYKLIRASPHTVSSSARRSPLISTRKINGNKFALLIGINAYPQPYELCGCLNDVALAESTLMRIGFDEGVNATTELGDGSSLFCERKHMRRTWKLCESFATREQILTCIAHFAAELREDDVFVLWFSGHGARVEYRSADGRRTGEDWSIVPYCNDWHEASRPDIASSDLMKAMKNFRTVNVSVVLDSCHSEGMYRGEKSGSSVRFDEKRVRGVPSCTKICSEYVPKKATRSPCDTFERPNESNCMSKFAFVSACASEEKALEMAYSSELHGVLSYRLCKVLNELGERVLTLSWNSVMSFVRSEMVLDSPQLPQVMGLTHWSPFGECAAELDMRCALIGVPGEAPLLHGGKLHTIGVHSQWNLVDLEGNVLCETSASPRILERGQVTAYSGVSCDLSCGPPPELELENVRAVCVGDFFGEGMSVAVWLDITRRDKLVAAAGIDWRRLQSSAVLELVGDEEDAEIGVSIKCNRKDPSLCSVVLTSYMEGATREMIVPFISLRELAMLVERCAWRIGCEHRLLSEGTGDVSKLIDVTIKQQQGGAKAQVVELSEVEGGINRKQCVLSNGKIYTLSIAIEPKYHGLLFVSVIELGAGLDVKVIHPTHGGLSTTPEHKRVNVDNRSICLPSLVFKGDDNSVQHVWRVLVSSAPAQFDWLQQDSRFSTMRSSEQSVRKKGGVLEKFLHEAITTFSFLDVECTIVESDHMEAQGEVARGSASRGSLPPLRASPSPSRFMLKRGRRRASSAITVVRKGLKKAELQELKKLIKDLAEVGTRLKEAEMGEVGETLKEMVKLLGLIRQKSYTDAIVQCLRCRAIVSQVIAARECELPDKMLLAHTKPGAISLAKHDEERRLLVSDWVLLSVRRLLIQHMLAMTYRSRGDFALANDLLDKMWVEVTSLEKLIHRFDDGSASDPQVMGALAEILDIHNRIHSEKGMLYLAIGQYDQALEELGAMMKFLPKENLFKVGIARNNIGKAFVLMGRMLRSIAHLFTGRLVVNSNIKWLSKLHEQDEKGTYQRSLGIAYGDLARCSNALAQYTKLKLEVETRERLPAKVTTLLSQHVREFDVTFTEDDIQMLWQSDVDRKLFKEALNASQQMQALTSAAADPGGVAIARQEECTAAIALRLPNMVELARESNKLNEETHARARWCGSARTLAKALCVDDKDGKGFVSALDELGNVIGQQESLFKRITSKIDRVALFEEFSHTFRLLQSIYVVQQHDMLALAAAEVSRSRSLITRTHECLYDLTEVEDGQHEEEVEKKARAQQLNSWMKQTLLSLQQAQKQLESEGTCVIVYSHMDTIYSEITENEMEEVLFSWCFLPGSEWKLQVHKFKKGRGLSFYSGALDTKLWRSPSSRAMRDSERRSIALESQQQVSKFDLLSWLYDDLIRPTELHNLSRDGKEIPKVLIIPTESLYSIPFAALMEGDQHLVDRWCITYAPSLSVYANALSMAGEKPPTSLSSSLVVGDPDLIAHTGFQKLKFAEEEASVISKLLGCEAITRSKATLHTITTSMRSAPILHLAAHGILDEMQDLYNTGTVLGAVALAEGEYLLAESVANMHLDTTRVAVLSCCNSGRGKETADGLLGFSHAFFSAGVPSMVVSQWLVDDRSGRMLMEKFYECLCAGKELSVALREAMLHIKDGWGRKAETLDWSDPSYWAPFILVGANQTVFSPAH